MYHSTAALLPDGRVFSTGGGHRFDWALEDQPYTEYFEPAYGAGTKPEYTFPPGAAPIYLPYDGQITIHRTAGPALTKATLVKLAAVTHGFDQGQMRIPLVINGGPEVYTIRGPSQFNSAMAPPGYYMLFVQTSSGAVSTGQYVRVGDNLASSWSCAATQLLAASETVCGTTPVNGVCPSGFQSQQAVALPVLDPTNGATGWEVVAPPGVVEKPLAPTPGEIASITAECVVACQQQWASAPEISANCAVPGVFDTPQLLEQDVEPTLDLIPLDKQDGSGILTGESLACTLGESCCQEFDELLCNATNHRPTAAGAPQGGPAEYEVSLASSTLTIGATGTPVVINLSGDAGYGFCASVTSGACPFYLDQVEASSGSGTTSVSLICDDQTTKVVTVSDITLRLVQPAFGIAAGVDEIGFPAGGLIFESSLMIDSVPYSRRRPITSPITGTASQDDFTMSNLDFGLKVPCNSSTATVSVTVELAAGNALAEPPWISIVLPSSPACTRPMALSAVYGDPDSDIVSVRWRMDGVLLSPTLADIVPTGTHTLSASATDARGATTTSTTTFQCN